MVPNLQVVIQLNKLLLGVGWLMLFLLVACTSTNLESYGQNALTYPHLQTQSKTSSKVKNTTSIQKFANNQGKIIPYIAPQKPQVPQILVLETFKASISSFYNQLYDVYLYMEVFRNLLELANPTHWAQSLEIILVNTTKQTSLSASSPNAIDVDLRTSEDAAAETIEESKGVLLESKPHSALSTEMLTNEELKSEAGSGNNSTQQFDHENMESASLASTDLIIQGYSKETLEAKLKETPFKIKDHMTTPSTSVTVLDVGTQTTNEALSNLQNIMEVEDDSTKATQDFLAGFNYTYTPDGDSRSHSQYDRYVRSLDPACEVLTHLKNYANKGDWQLISNDSSSSFSLQTLTKASLAHSQGWLGEGVIVAILDSGTNENDASDCHNTTTKEKHGTNIRNIINLLAPKAHWVSKRVFGRADTSLSNSAITTLDLVTAITDIERKYLTKGHKVIFNMSFSGPAHPQYGPDVTLWGILKRLEEIYGNHFLVVASVGNHGLNPEQRRAIYYPSGFSRTFYDTTMTLPAVTNIISVGTAGVKNGQLQAAELNPEVEAIDVLGLGIKLCLDSQNTSKCDLDNNQALTGTSYAVPVVSAAAAILWQQQPSVPAASLKSLMQHTTIAVANSSVGLVKVTSEADQENNSSTSIDSQFDNFYELTPKAPSEYPINTADETILTPIFPMALTPGGSTTSPN